MTPTWFEVIPHPTRAPGYAIKAQGERPSWSPTGVFGWYRRRADALARAAVLNKAEQLREVAE